MAPAASMAIQMSRVQRALETLEGKPASDTDGILASLRSARIVVPGQIERAMDRMHEFNNEIVGPVRTAFTSALAYNVVVDRAILAASDHLEPFEKSRPEIVRNAMKMAKEADRSLKALTSMRVRE